MTNDFFSGRFAAALGAVLLSSTMLFGSIGPAFDIQPVSLSAPGHYTA